MEFDQPCAPDSSDVGTMNVFDVRYVKEITVKGSATNDVIWAMVVTAQGAPTS